MHALALALAFAFGTTAAAPGETLLDICRSAYESFEPKAAVKSCSAAADVSELTVTQRIEALRYLAQSHILATEDEDAARAFTRMLVLDDALLLTRDAGPRERDIFARARTTLEQKGRITATHTLDDDDRLRVEVRDPLARVASARVRVRDDDRISVALLAGTRSDGVLVVSGPLPTLAGAAAVRYEIMLQGHTGALLAVDAPLRGKRKYFDVVTTRDGKREVVAQEKPFDTFGYSVIATGVGLEAYWLLGCTPALAATYPPEEWISVALLGAASLGLIVAAGTAIVLTGPEAQ